MSGFLRDYLTVVWFGGLALVLGSLMLGVAALIRPDKPNPSKLIAYESGVEAVFLFPWAASVERYGAFGLVVMLAFIVLLLDGLLYAWKRGLLRWV